jgi:hypothetical protein
MRCELRGRFSFLVVRVDPQLHRSSRCMEGAKAPCSQARLHSPAASSIAIPKKRDG